MSANTGPETTGPENQHDDPNPNRQHLSDARRFHIVAHAVKNRSAAVAELLADNNFRRRFKGSEQSVKDDFQYLATTLLPNPVVLKATPDVVECRPRQAFADLHYGAGEKGKRAIARLIVDEYLNNPKEVAYLSTGTTVYEAAVALLGAVEKGDKSNIDRIVTDNLAVVDLFCSRARESERIRKIKFTIIGGTADFDQGDVALEEDTFTQLEGWEFSTAVVSATKINEDTGTICSSRQPGTKIRFFRTAVVGQFIIPVTSEKISPKAGGKLVYDPNPRKSETTRKHVVVTDRLDAKVKEKLEQWYAVRVAPPVVDSNV